MITEVLQAVKQALSTKTGALSDVRLVQITSNGYLELEEGTPLPILAVSPVSNTVQRQSMGRRRHQHPAVAVYILTQQFGAERGILQALLLEEAVIDVLDGLKLGNAISAVWTGTNYPSLNEKIYVELNEIQVNFGYQLVDTASH